MSAQLLAGYTFHVDGYAINDFESLAAGDITNLNDNVIVTGGLSWLDSVLIERGAA